MVRKYMLRLFLGDGERGHVLTPKLLLTCISAESDVEPDAELAAVELIWKLI